MSHDGMMMAWIVDGLAVLVNCTIFNFIKPFVGKNILHCSSILNIDGKHLGNDRS